MRLYSWNVNGWRAACRKGLRDWVKETGPDLLCTQESKADPAKLTDEESRLEGYGSCWAVAERAGYSGVSTFSKIPGQTSHAGLGIERFDREGRVVVTDCGDFDLYNVYFPNGKKDGERLAFKLDFYAAFLAHINQKAAAGRPVIFCGDVNTAHQPIDLARPKENQRISGFLPEERACMDQWQQAGWVDSFRHLHPDEARYSWWSQRTDARSRDIGWRLDYFWVHQSLLPRLRAAGIATEVMGSDHCPVWLEII
ncbi:exodeoxyribonuclease III [Acidithiobacillus sulfurivorans]|uniref:Exodeoxyribonuclease III n=1 Tax=Acidithiobacillus sulfurivorans TaxID=1958756 RepID=A0ABS6A1T2_9PROT|nr:exodeoxyribonuclease III [Acidithiobacillus sulfurivorans]MBU2761337.1 exodeoxyribonuclease III [Acidithiobacillus sulfurivorans]